jgi:hypothetical protein
MQAQTVADPNAFASALQGGFSMGMLGSAMQQAQAQQDLLKAQKGFFEGMTPPADPSLGSPTVGAASPNQTPWGSMGEISTAMPAGSITAGTPPPVAGPALPPGYTPPMDMGTYLQTASLPKVPQKSGMSMLLPF